MKGFIHIIYFSHCARSFLTFVLLVLFQHSIISQSHNFPMDDPDNLGTMLESAEGRERVDLLLEMSKAKWYQSFDESMDYATKGYQLARELDYREGVADALNRIGNVHYLLRNYDEVLDRYKHAAEIATELNDHRRMGIYLNNIGLLYRELSLYDSAEIYLVKALETKEEYGDSALISSTLTNLGVLYRDMENFNLALECFFRQLEIYRETGNFQNLSFIHRQVGEVYYLSEQYADALEHYREAIEYATGIADTLSIARSYHHFARVMLETENFNEARESILKSLEMAKGLSEPVLKQNNYNLLYRYYKITENHKQALDYLIIYNQLRDSLRNQNSTARYSQLETIFDIEQQNRRIELLQKENEIQELQISRQNYTSNLLLALIFVLIVFKLFVVYRYSIIQKTNRLLKQKIDELLNTNEKLRLSTLTLEHLNMTKNRFFSIIAHDLKNPFNALLGFSEIISTSFHELKEDEVREYIGFVHQSSRNLYKLLENLLKWSATQTGTMRYLPEKFDLVSLINSEIHFMRMSAGKKQITLSKNLPEELLIRSDRLLISSVIRNLTDNAIKFTRPGGEVAIHAEEKDDEVIVKVEDSGIGIPKEMQDKLFTLNGDISRKGTNMEEGGGLGLILCKELIEKADGEIGVYSKNGNGSCFWFSLPLSRNNN